MQDSEVLEFQRMIEDSGLWTEFLLEKDCLVDLAGDLIAQGKQPEKNLAYVQQCEVVKKLVNDIEYTYAQLKARNVKAVNFLNEWTPQRKRV